MVYYIRFKPNGVIVHSQCIHHFPLYLLKNVPGTVFNLILCLSHILSAACAGRYDIDQILTLAPIYY